MVIDSYSALCGKDDSTTTGDGTIICYAATKESAGLKCAAGYFAAGSKCYFAGGLRIG
jgi:hypothetical protein